VRVVGVQGSAPVARRVRSEEIRQRGGRRLPRERLIVILHVHVQRQAELAHVAAAGRLARLVVGFSEHREQDRGENGGYRNNNEKLDQREASPFHGPPAPFRCTSGKQWLQRVTPPLARPFA